MKKRKLLKAGIMAAAMGTTVKLVLDEKKKQEELKRKMEIEEELEERIIQIGRHILLVGAWQV